MYIIKLISVALLCLLVCLLLKQTKPEFYPFAQIASVIVLAVMVTDYLKELLQVINDLVGETDIIENGYILLLIKVLGIAMVTKMASDICKDNGNSVLATNIELVGKIFIFAMCVPFIRTIIELSKGLLN